LTTVKVAKWGAYMWDTTENRIEEHEEPVYVLCCQSNMTLEMTEVGHIYE